MLCSDQNILKLGTAELMTTLPLAQTQTNYLMVSRTFNVNTLKSGHFGWYKLCYNANAHSLLFLGATLRRRERGREGEGGRLGEGGERGREGGERGGGERGRGRKGRIRKGGREGEEGKRGGDRGTEGGRGEGVGERGRKGGGGRLV